MTHQVGTKNVHAGVERSIRGAVVGNPFTLFREAEYSEAIELSEMLGDEMEGVGYEDFIPHDIDSMRDAEEFEGLENLRNRDRKDLRKGN